MRPPTTKPKMKMNSSADIQGATKAWIGTRIMRETSRRTMVFRPIQLMPSGGLACMLLARHVIGFGAGRHQIGLFQSARAARDLLLGAQPRDAPLGDNGDLAAEAFDFLEIVRGQKDGLAALVDLGEIAPQHP